MRKKIQNVKTGQVTYAVRDTKIDDKRSTKAILWESEMLESWQ